MLTPSFQFLLTAMAGWVNRSQQEVIEYLQTENRVLRNQLGGRRLRLSDAERRVLAVAAKRVGRKGLLGIGPMVTPDTLPRWYRRLVAQKYDGSGARGVGRPKAPAAIYNLNQEVSRGTISRILLENGIEPAPERGEKLSWETFLKSHWGAIAATDFFSVEVLTPKGLVRYLVLFVIDLKTRRIDITGIVRRPASEWMKHMARNLSYVSDGFLCSARYLIHDRDPLFTRELRGILRAVGVETVRLP